MQQGLMPGWLKDLLLVLLLLALLLIECIPGTRLDMLCSSFVYDMHVHVFEIALVLLLVTRRFNAPTFIQLFIATIFSLLLLASLGRSMQASGSTVYNPSPEMLSTLHTLGILQESNEFSAILAMKDEALKVAHTLLQPTRNKQYWGRDVQARYVGGDACLVLRHLNILFITIL